MFVHVQRSEDKWWQTFPFHYVSAGVKLRSSDLKASAFPGWATSTPPPMLLVILFPFLDKVPAQLLQCLSVEFLKEDRKLLSSNCVINIVFVRYVAHTFNPITWGRGRQISWVPGQPETWIETSKQASKQPQNNHSLIISTNLSFVLLSFKAWNNIAMHVSVF